MTSSLGAERILAEIEQAIRAHERSLIPRTPPVPVPCVCSWCRRQGMTRALPLPRVAVQRPRRPWWRVGR